LKKVDPKCLVGGPETTGYEPKWIKYLLSASNQRNFDVDFLCFHQFEDPSNLITSAELARQQYKQEKGKTPEIHIGEWGFEVKNAFLAQQHLAVAEESGVGFYCKDFFFERKWKCSIVDDEYRKRDMFHLFHQYTKLGRARYGCHSDSGLVKLIASPYEEEIIVIIGARGEMGKSIDCDVRTTKGDLLKITSIKEISNDGLVSRDIRCKGASEISIECQKAYILKGEV